MYLPGLEPKKHKFIAFDLETFSPEEPYGISVAATCQDGQSPRLWYESPLAECLPLSPRQAGFLVDYLKIAVDREYTLLTWNGLAFDFKVLGEVSGMWDTCGVLALNHVDMMFQFFCRYGYWIGMNAIAHGLGLPGKDGHEAVSGALAPVAWRESKEKRIEVCKYAEADVATLLGIAKEATKQGCFKWLSTRGRQMNKPFSGTWRTVKECLAMPPPDVDWIKEPHTRVEMMDWIFTIKEAKR